MKARYTIFLFLIIYAATPIIQAQDLANLGKQKPFQWQSNIQLGTTLYDRSTEGAYSAPFAWYLHGQMLFSIYGIQIPLSISFRNQQYNYSAVVPLGQQT